MGLCIVCRGFVLSVGALYNLFVALCSLWGLCIVAAAAVAPRRAAPSFAALLVKHAWGVTSCIQISYMLRPLPLIAPSSTELPHDPGILTVTVSHHVVNREKPQVFIRNSQEWEYWIPMRNKNIL